MYRLKLVLVSGFQQVLSVNQGRDRTISHEWVYLLRSPLTFVIEYYNIMMLEAGKCFSAALRYNGFADRVLFPPPEFRASA